MPGSQSNYAIERSRKDEIDRFKTDINLTEYAASLGYEINRKESCRNAVIMRRGEGGDKIVVRCDQDGHYTYFNVQDRSDSGSIIDFVQKRLGGGASVVTLGHVRVELRNWLGEDKPIIEIADYQPKVERSVADRDAVTDALSKCRIPTTWNYLLSRGLTIETLTSQRFSGRILQDGRGNMIFPHSDQEGSCGYEVKNNGFTGFAPGGLKSVWHSHTKPTDNRLVFSEVAIDALSHFQLFDDGRTRYLSFAGGLNDYQRDTVIPQAILKMPPGSTIVSAFDNDKAGDGFHDLVTPHITGDYLSYRHSPPPDLDWNDVLPKIKS